MDSFAHSIIPLDGFAEASPEVQDLIVDAVEGKMGRALFANEPKTVTKKPVAKATVTVTSPKEPKQKPVSKYLVERFCDELSIKKVSDLRPRWEGTKKFNVSTFVSGKVQTKLEVLDWAAYAAKLVSPDVAHIKEV